MDLKMQRIKGEAYIFGLDHNGSQHLQLVILVRGKTSDVETLTALHGKLVELDIEPAQAEDAA